MAASEQAHVRLAREFFGEAEENNLPLLSAYFDFYDKLIPENRPSNFVINIDQPPAQPTTVHEDIFRISAFLRKDPKITRRKLDSLCEGAFPIANCDEIIRIAIKAMLMIDCSASDNHARGFEIDGFRPSNWWPDEPFGRYLKRIFPMITDDQEEKSSRQAYTERRMFKGWKLEKRAHVQFKPTNNLTEHLLYDPRDGVVRIFHHTAFLKAHLRRGEALSHECEFAQSIAAGTLPPQLLLETLDSLQIILFPTIDEKSTGLLQRLVDDPSTNFDRDCLDDDGHIRDLPPDFTYRYWGKRLSRLHLLAKDPKPKGRMAQWVQRHTSERNALYVAILGLFLAVLFGFLSLIIGIVQAWVAYKAWKHPIAPPFGTNFP